MKYYVYLHNDIFRKKLLYFSQAGAIIPCGDSIQKEFSETVL